MALDAFILDLVAPAQVGDELVPGARLLGTSTELGPRLTFDVGGQEVHVEVAPADTGRPHAARSEKLMFSYRAASGDTRVDPDVGLWLCRALARVASDRERTVLARLGAAAAQAAEQSEGSARVREVHVTRLLEPSGSRGRRYFTLSPYVGCLIGCRFCYAQSRTNLVRRLEGLPEAPWGSYVDARVNAPEVLARELDQLPPYPVKFCPIVSDPYQAVEKRYELTRRCLGVLRDSKPRPTLVLTRSTLLDRDIDVLASMPDARAGVSIPTVDEEARRHFEPRAADVAGRLRLLSALKAAGVQTFAVVQPILPGSIQALAEALAERVASVSIDVLHGVEGAETQFSAVAYSYARQDEWQRERAMELAEILTGLGVAVWRGELPPDLVTPD